MGEYSMTDPDEVGQKEVDGQGRLYLGAGYEKEEVEFAVRVINED